MRYLMLSQFEFFKSTTDTLLCFNKSYMKKRFAFFLFLIIPLAPLAIHLAAAETAQGAEETVIPGKIAPLPPTQYPNILGQDHRYSVVFRGNGEAIVTLKTAFSNTTDKPLSEISLRVPKVDPKDIAVFQVIREPVCIRYKESPVVIQKQSGSTESLIYPAPPSANPPKCEEYQDPDYFQSWYGSAKYQKASFELRGDSIVVTLPQAVKANLSGSFITYYRAFGYAKKNVFGAYSFAFETLKVNDKIRSLQVGLATDSDLFLRGTRGNVNYRFEEPTASLKAIGGAAEAVANSQFDRFSQQIGQGTIVKTASNLSPLESYTVKGSYADTYAKLYAKELLVAFCAVIVIILLMALIIKVLLKLWKKHSLGASVKVKEATPVNTTLDLLAVFGLSFLSSAAIVVTTVLVIITSRWFSQLLPSDVVLLATICIMFIMLFLYLVLIVGPAIFMGIRRGLGWGVATFAVTIFWLFIHVLIVLFVLLLLTRSSRLSSPIPLMEQMMGGVSNSSQSAPSSGSVTR